MLFEEFVEDSRGRYETHTCDNTHEAQAEAGGLLPTQGKLGCIAIPSFLKAKQDDTKQRILYNRKGKLIKIRGLLIINNLKSDFTYTDYNFEISLDMGSRDTLWAKVLLHKHENLNSDPQDPQESQV